MAKNEKALPRIVSRDKWLVAHKNLLAREKAATRARDALAAKRRTLPMVKIEKDYVFEGTNGKASLLDLFEGRRQLIIYHFMFGPNQEVGCDGCSMFVDPVGHLAHLHARTPPLLWSRERQSLRSTLTVSVWGWTIPWFSSFKSDFNHAFGVGPKSPQPKKYQDGESFGLSVFLRDGEAVHRTYFTSGRGVEAFGSVWAVDAPLGSNPLFGVVETGTCASHRTLAGMSDFRIWGDR